MESIVKKYYRDRNVVNQRFTVYDNKGSTNQHSFVQLLLDGLKNFFITVSLLSMLNHVILAQFRPMIMVVLLSE